LSALRVHHAAPGSVPAILAGVPDPVLSYGEPGQRCGWQPCGFCPSRCRSRFFDARFDALTDTALVTIRGFRADCHWDEHQQRGTAGSRHAAVPGFAIVNLPVNPVSGTGKPGTPLNFAGPLSMQSPGSCPWYESLPGFAPGAGNS